jgi:hypothetical protein
LLFGFPKNEDENKPLLTHDSLEQVSVISEAEMLPLKMFCIG